MIGRTARRGLVVAASVCLASVPVGLVAQTDFLVRAHFIDVGQGDATLLEFACGAVLVDTGGERFPDEGDPLRFDSNVPLYDYLRAFFSGRPDLGGRLDALYLTHPHIDHTRGVAMVLAELAPRNVIYNGRTSGSGADGQAAARQYAQATEDVGGYYVLEPNTRGPGGLTNAVIDPLDCGEAGDPEVRVFWGQVTDSTGWEQSDFDNENNHSLVIRFAVGDASILFTGDLEASPGAGTGGAAVERLLARHGDGGALRADVFQIGHHGSQNGTTPPLVQAVAPEIAVVSMGPPCRRGRWSAWQYGHVRAAALDALAAGVSGTREPAVELVFPAYQQPPDTVTVGRAIYATGWDGTVVATAALDGTWSVETDPPSGCEGS